MDTLLFLGTGDSMGVPRVYCSCSVCEEARATGTNRRYRSSVLLQTEDGDLLIDCGPDWLTQMERLRRRTLADVLITHAHHDHIAGLPEWFDACRWAKTRGTIYTPQSVIPTIQRQYPWLDKRLTFHANDDGMQFGGWSIQPWEVCHGRNGTSYAYLFAKAGYTWAYCSDAIALTAQQKQPLHDLDLLILGTNFYEEPYEMATRSVYDMVEAMELLEELQPKRAYFTHLSHGVDVAANYPLPDTVTIARHDMQIELGRL